MGLRVSFKYFEQVLLVVLGLILLSPDFNQAQSFSCDKYPGYQKAFELSNELQKKALHCLEQEVIEPLVNPVLLKSFALKKCQLAEECINFLKRKASEISGLNVSYFENYNAIGLWERIEEYAGLKRSYPLQLSDLPLAGDPAKLFDELVKEKTIAREADSLEAFRVACSALFLLIGPSKAKVAFRAVLDAPKLRVLTIEISKDVTKAIKQNRIPAKVLEKFEKWKAQVKSEGIEQVRKTPGFHDEPLTGELKGQRSIRLDNQYRANYEIKRVGDQDILEITRIHPHDY